MENDLLIYLSNISNQIRGTKCDLKEDQFLGDLPAFRDQLKKNVTLRTAFDWIEEFADLRNHGYDMANGVPMEIAEKLFPHKCFELLIASGMPHGRAIELMPQFVI